MASLHADEASRDHTSGAGQPRTRRLALRFRPEPHPGRDQLLVGQFARSRQSAHQRGAARPTRVAGARHAGGVHPRAGGRARRAAGAAGARKAGPLFFCLGRFRGGRNRAQDELSLLEERRQCGEGHVRYPLQQLSRRDDRGACRDRYSALPENLCASAPRQRASSLARLAAGRSGRNARGVRAALCPRAGSSSGTTLPENCGVRRRAPGAVRGRHGHVRSGVPARRPETLRPLRGSSHCRRNRRRLWPYRQHVRVRPGRYCAGFPVPLQGAYRRLPPAFGSPDQRRRLSGVLR